MHEALGRPHRFGHRSYPNRHGIARRSDHEFLLRHAQAAAQVGHAQQRVSDALGALALLHVRAVALLDGPGNAVLGAGSIAAQRQADEEQSTGNFT